MDTRSRLKAAMAEAGVASAAELSRRTRPKIKEVTVRAYLSAGTNARNPPLDVCNVLGRVLGVNGQWLYDGKGPRKPEASVPDGLNAAVTQVPLIDAVQAGRLAKPTSQIPLEDVPLLAFADLGSGEWFALRVEGSSMDRVSPEGSTIIVNRADRQLISGRCYVFAVRGETTYKRWQGGDPPYLEPYSTDTVHKPIFPRAKRDLEVIGRVKRTLLDL